MPDRTLYTLSIPANAQTLDRSEVQRNLATQGLLDGSTAAVESLSLDPNQELLRGQYRGRYARLMAAEVEELFDAGSIDEVPFYTPGDDRGGYFALENVDVEAVDPNLDELREFDGVLTKKGTRETHRRRVATNPKQVENDFGNTQQCLVGIPAAASDVWWYNSETESTADPSVVATHAGEHGDIAVYDALAAPFDQPMLVYDLPYSRQGKVDVVVWDDHDREKLDSDGVNSWQWVFTTSHEFDGAARIDNGLLRVQLDDALAVEEWDDAAGAWSSVALGASSWELDAWDLTRISPERVDAQVRFRDPGQSPTQYYSLNLSVQRGWQTIHWTVPESLRKSDTPETPTGLQDLLAPVASDSDYRPQAEQGLVSREEVRA